VLGVKHGLECATRQVIQILSGFIVNLHSAVRISDHKFAEFLWTKGEIRRQLEVPLYRAIGGVAVTTDIRTRESRTVRPVRRAVVMMLVNGRKPVIIAESTLRIIGERFCPCEQLESRATA